MDAEPYRVYLRGEMGKNGPQDRVNVAVDGMTDPEALWLTTVLSTIRDNSVARTLARLSTDWETKEVPISLVTVNDAEKELRDAFERDHRRLSAIVRDPEVLTHPEYASREPGATVDYWVPLAHRDGHNGYRVFDGIHRAIQLVRNGVDTLTLCVVS